MTPDSGALEPAGVHRPPPTLGSALLPILWAQWRLMSNFRVRGVVAARAVSWLVALLWYLLWVFIGLGAAAMAVAAQPQHLSIGVPWTLMSVFAYWQLAPVLTASMGTTLDLRKLLAYPIPERSLFLIEVLLRLTTGVEMVILLVVGGIGLAANPAVPDWAPALGLPLFAVFNLLVAAGMRNLLERLFARKWLRELMIFGFVLLTALPQLLVFTGVGGAARSFFQNPSVFLPWGSFAGLALGRPLALAVPLVLIWTMAGYWFGVRQFRASLSFDAAEAAPAPVSRRGIGLDRILSAPARFFRDPVSALVEKELKSLARSPRFRLVFLMGFSFGFIIWLPAFREEGGGMVGENYPVFVAIYGLLLLGEVVVWNVFGFDRSAAALYLVSPLRFSQVLIAKNVASLIVGVVEVVVIAVVCALLPLRVPPMKLLEAFCVAMVAMLYLTATGNLSSVHYPRAMNPEHSWGRHSGTRFQFFLLFLFPLIMAPVFLAYLARYAFETDLAFYGTLAVSAALGLIYYWVALDSALNAIGARRERFLEALTPSAGPLASE